MRGTLWIAAAIGAIVLAAAASSADDAMPENPKPNTSQQALATFAGGCFWCMQPDFDALGDAVISTTVGYTGGTTPNPTYEEVCSGKTGHAEAIQIAYDPAKVSYERLLQIYWENIDPTQADGQFADHGAQYRTAIFTHGEEQKRLAEASKEKLARSGKFSAPIVTEIVPAGVFYPAEEHHQKYYKKNPVHYTLYSEGSGRKPFIRRTWGKKH